MNSLKSMCWTCTPFLYDLSRKVADCFRCWERSFEGKGIRGLAVGTQVGQTLLCLLDTGDMTGGNPPECQVGAIEALKPLKALLQYLAVPTLVDEGGEIGEASPQREVHENEVVLEWPQACGVSFLRLQPPEKAGTAFAQHSNGL